MVNSRLEDSIQYVKGVGPRRFTYLKKLGITRVWDMLWHAPRHYFDRSHVTPINQLVPGQQSTIKVLIKAVKVDTTRRGMKIVRALVEDGTGMIYALWFNQPYLKRSLRPGTAVFLTGNIQSSRGRLEMTVREHEKVEGNTVLGAARIVPVYRATEGLGVRNLRGIAYQVLQDYAGDYPEILPAGVRERHDLIDIHSAWWNLHFPKSSTHLEAARRRLAFEEMLLWQWALFSHREQRRKDSSVGVPHRGGQELVKLIAKGLPFALTSAQARVVREIFADLAQERPMNRLVQGDVGSGKTVVAALAAVRVVGGGFQIAFMAPTEILAVQHYQALASVMIGTGIKIALLTGKTPAAEKKRIIADTAEGRIDILVGTHALIEEQVNFARLGLVVIDEQQRFGVRQRASLAEKGTVHPDVLVMTATPIPRTLALTYYGELDVSIIDEMPPGRKKVKTMVVKPGIKQRLYRFIAQTVAQGKQVYVVCPLVEESEKQDLHSATTLRHILANQVFPHLQVGLLHGKMKSDEKEAVTAAFRRGEIHILVTTTVIEVGIDVPNATVMIVVHAERFGLSQLHQLRGRVGRGEDQSYCILVSDPRTADSWKRLKIMEKTSDGFEVAEQDLALRGPGDFLGVRQHGLPEFKVADLIKDTSLLDAARRELAAGSIERELLNDLLLLQRDFLSHYANN